MSLMKERVSSVISSVSKDAAQLLSRLYLRHPGLEDIVVGSGISSSFENYVIKVSKIIIFTTFAPALASGVYTYSISGELGFSVFIGLATAFAAVFPLSYSISLAVPILSYKNRGSIIEAKLPLLISLMSLIATSERSVFKSLEILHRDYHDVLKDFMIELDTVVYLVRLGYPLQDALARVARITPSPTLREILFGLSASATVSGEPLRLVASAAEKYLDRYALKVESVVNELGVMLEIYLAVALLTPILAGALGALLVLSPVGGLSFEVLASLLSYLIVPASSIVSLIVIDAAVSKVVI